MADIAGGVAVPAQRFARGSLGIVGPIFLIPRYLAPADGVLGRRCLHCLFEGAAVRGHALRARRRAAEQIAFLGIA